MTPTARNEKSFKKATATTRSSTWYAFISLLLKFLLVSISVTYKPVASQLSWLSAVAMHLLYFKYIQHTVFHTTFHESMSQNKTKKTKTKEAEGEDNKNFGIFSEEGNHDQKAQKTMNHHVKHGF